MGIRIKTLRDHLWNHIFGLSSREKPELVSMKTPLKVSATKDTGTIPGWTSFSQKQTQLLKARLLDQNKQEKGIFQREQNDLFDKEFRVIFKVTEFRSEAKIKPTKIFMRKSIEQFN